MEIIFIPKGLLQGISELNFIGHLAQWLAYWYVITSGPFIPCIMMVTSKILGGGVGPSQRDIAAKKKMSLLKRKILFTSCWWGPVWFFGTRRGMSMTVTFLRGRTEKPFLWLRQVCIGHIISDSDNDSSFHAIPVSFMPGIDRWVHTTSKPWQ